MTDRSRQAGFRAAVGPAPATSRAAAASPAVSRAQFFGANINRAAEKVDDDDNDEKKAKGETIFKDKDGDDEKPKDKDNIFKAKDGDDDDEKPKDKVEKAASAGTAGDFESVSGDPWGSDNNADKGENPAPNSTGVPSTPSGASV